jgi:hypothetical protein
MWEIPPEARLGRRERAVFWVAVVAIAVTRLMAIARTPWDWDEFDFMLALQKYDVRAHHPHPPGSPTFVLFAQIAHLLVRDEFRSLLVVSTVAAVLLFPVAFLLLRELRFGFAEAVGGGALLCFLPNVWFFGGTGFSDMAGTTLLLASVAMFVRGCGDRNAYWLGSLLLGLAGGMRPQVLLAGLAPGLLATWHHRRRPFDILVSLLIGALVMGCAYGIAAHLSGGWSEYRRLLESFNRYNTQVDSYHNKLRPPLASLLEPFFVSPYGNHTLGWELTVLAGISLLDALVRRRWNVWFIAAMFVPLMAASWLRLDHFSRSRYAITYAGMQAFLAVDGVAALARLVRLPSRAQIAIVGGAVLGFVGYSWSWTAPALKIARTTASPPVQALEWLRAHTGPGDEIFVDLGLHPHAAYMLADRKYVEVRGETAARPTAGVKAYFAGEGRHSERSLVEFHRAHGSLLEMVRKRYFDIRIFPLHQIPIYLDGWDDLEENRAGASWRWMRGSGTLRVPPFATGGELALVFGVASRAGLTVRSEGKVLDQFSGVDGTMTRIYDFPAGSQPHTLEIATDQVVNPRQLGVSDDDRILGLQLFKLEWVPAGTGTPRVALLDGWYGAESKPPLSWHWARKIARAKLSSLDTPGVLTLDLESPHARDGRSILEEVTVQAGPIADTIRLEGRTQRSYILPASAHAHDLTITSDQAVSPATQGLSADTRELALQVFSVDWRRADPAGR